MRRSTIGAAIFLCVACGGRTDSLTDETSDAGGFSSFGGSTFTSSITAGGRSGAGAGASTMTGIIGGAWAGLGGRSLYSGTSGRGGATAIWAGGTAGRGGSTVIWAGAAAGRGGATVIWAGGTAGRGGSGTIVGGSTSVLPICGQLQPGSCERCLCNSCSSQLSACADDEACVLIATCVVQTGCLMTGVGCNSPTTCGTLIDLAGGVWSPRVVRATEVGMCRLTSSCGC